MFRRFKGFRRKPHLLLQTRPHWLGNRWTGADPDPVPGALGLSLSENPGREIAAAPSSALLAPLGLFSWQRCRQSTGNGPISHCQSPPAKGLQGQHILTQEKARLPQLLGQKFLLSKIFNHLAWAPAQLNHWGIARGWPLHLQVVIRSH